MAWNIALESIGVAQTTIDNMKKLTGLSGDAAREQVRALGLDSFRIDEAQRSSLFASVWPDLGADKARTRATRALTKKDKTTTVSAERYESLDDATREFLADIAFQGAYGGGRRQRINTVLANENLDTVGRLTAIRSEVETWKYEGEGKVHSENGRRLRLEFLDNAIADARANQDGSTTGPEPSQNADPALPNNGVGNVPPGARKEE